MGESEEFKSTIKEKGSASTPSSSASPNAEVEQNIEDDYMHGEGSAAESSAGDANHKKFYK